MTTICGHTIDEYTKMIVDFHGNFAPGLLIGGFMVDLAMRERPGGEFFDALCETPVCLPDAIQLLTPCTLGNGWLRVVNVGRFALTLYEKYTGAGIRVCLDAAKLEDYPAVKEWFMKLKPKKEQDRDELVRQIIAGGDAMLSVSAVKVAPRHIGKVKGRKIALCPVCREVYPEGDDATCLACAGAVLYETC